jgi:hypothetical protein
MTLIPISTDYVIDNIVNEYDIICKFIILPLIGIFSISIIYFNKKQNKNIINGNTLYT